MQICIQIQSDHKLCSTYVLEIVPKLKITYSQKALGAMVGWTAKVLFPRSTASFCPPFILFLFLFLPRSYVHKLNVCNLWVYGR